MKRFRTRRKTVHGTRDIEKAVERLSRALEADRVAVVDAGARFGTHLQERFYPLEKQGLLEYTGFEPDEAECRRLEQEHPEHEFRPVALGEKEGEKELVETDAPGCSSFLKPGRRFLQHFPRIAPWFEVTGREKVEMTTLDRFLKESGTSADLLKSDTQGYEMEILEGARKNLDDISVIELEVFFKQVYMDQALFDEIYRFLAERGFELVDMEFARWNRGGKVNTLGHPGGERKVDGELVEADVLFSRTGFNSRHKLEKTVLLLASYGKFSTALRITRENNELLEEDEEAVDVLEDLAT